MSLNKILSGGNPRGLLDLECNNIVVHEDMVIEGLLTLTDLTVTGETNVNNLTASGLIRGNVVPPATGERKRFGVPNTNGEIQVVASDDGGIAVYEASSPSYAYLFGLDSAGGGDFLVQNTASVTPAISVDQSNNINLDTSTLLTTGDIKCAHVQCDSINVTTVTPSEFVELKMIGASDGGLSFQPGDAGFTTFFNVPTPSADTTVTFPDAKKSASSVVLTEGDSQTINGPKVFKVSVGIQDQTNDTGLRYLNMDSKTTSWSWGLDPTVDRVKLTNNTTPLDIMTVYNDGFIQTAAGISTLDGALEAAGDLVGHGTSCIIESATTDEDISLSLSDDTNGFDLTMLSTDTGASLKLINTRTNDEPLIIDQSNNVSFPELTPNTALVLNASNVLTSVALGTGEYVSVTSLGVPAAVTLTGTSNQVTLTTALGGGRTISLPQDIATDSDVTFQSVAASSIDVGTVTMTGSLVTANIIADDDVSKTLNICADADSKILNLGTGAAMTGVNVGGAAPLTVGGTTTSVGSYSTTFTTSYTTAVGDVVSVRPSDGKLALGFGEAYTLLTPNDVNGNPCGGNTGLHTIAVNTNVFVSAAICFDNANADGRASIWLEGHILSGTTLTPSGTPVILTPTGGVNGSSSLSNCIHLLKVSTTNNTFGIATLSVTGPAWTVYWYTVNGTTGIITACATASSILTAAVGTIPNDPNSMRGITLSAGSATSVFTVWTYRQGSGAARAIKAVVVEFNPTTGNSTGVLVAELSIATTGINTGTSVAGMYDISSLGVDTAFALTFFDNNVTSTLPRISGVTLAVGALNVITITAGPTPLVTSVVTFQTNSNGMRLSYLQTTGGYYKLMCDWFAVSLQGRTTQVFNVDTTTGAWSGTNHASLATPLVEYNLARYSSLLGTNSEFTYNVPVPLSATQYLAGYQESNTTPSVTTRLVNISALDAITYVEAINRPGFNMASSYSSTAYDGTSFVFSWRSNLSQKAMACVGTAINLTTGFITLSPDRGRQPLGLAQQVSTSGNSCRVVLTGRATTASTLIPAQPYFISYDGTVTQYVISQPFLGPQGLIRNAISTTELLM